MKARKQYSKEFQLDAISLVLDRGYSRKEAADSLDINRQMLGRWIYVSPNDFERLLMEQQKAA